MSEAATTTAALLVLGTALRERLCADALAWLEEGIEQVATAAQPLAPLAQSFAAAARRLGEDPMGDAVQRLDSGCGILDASRWGLADAGRALLLGAATARPGVPWVELLGGLYRDGDEGERASLMRALCLTPEPCHLRALALTAGRITSLRLYAALALDNPFPASCYPQHDFNGMVLKCLFNALPVARISGLAGRTNPELSRMCEDYREERLLAGRTVPPDIWLPLVPHASPRGLAAACDALGSPDPRHRYYAVLALRSRRSEPMIGEALAARRGLETEPHIIAVLTQD